jgi:DNA polymerase III epsilon subunit family exonuclease
MNLDRDLNEQQRQAVHFGDAPLLVLAGPGTGKTRVITYRVAHLIESGRVPPKRILTLTFTNKAAQELGERVYKLLGESVGGEVWIGTFHNICSRLLREEPEAYGIRPDFAVFDQETQQAILRDCLRRAGLPADDAGVVRVRDFISAEKASLRDPGDATVSLLDDDGNPMDDPRYMDRVRTTIQAYAERLRSHGALDFDDLLVAVTAGLQKNPTLRRQTRQRFRHILVDEYQDINEAQYEFLKAVCAKPFALTAVGDEDQSIYAWRGSSPEWIRRFREDYRPEVIELEVNYRSTRTVLDAAAELIGHNRRERQKPLVTDADAGSPIYAYRFGDEEEAASHCARVLRKLVEDAHIPYRDIGVFYRNHRHADLLEQKLRQAGVPVQRLLPASQMLDSRESGILAWLQFLAFGLDTDLLEALRFPTNVLDEWTRVWLQRRALRESRPFSEVVRHLGAETPPLTRVTLERTLRRMDALKERVASKPVPEVVRALLAELERHRSPYAALELETVMPSERFPSLADAADVLLAALERGVVPHLVATGHLDDLSAALLVRETLGDYFGVDAPLSVVDAGTPLEEAPPLTLIFGEAVPPEDPERRFVHFGAPVEAWSRLLCPRPPEDAPQSTAWTAFRFCQRLLEVSEQLDEEDVVVYDLETTGNNVRRAEIVEFAATRLSRPERHEHRYIRPKGQIPAFLTRIHGINEATVRDKPSIEELVAPIREFLGDAILVGHNISDFDNRLLEREFSAYLGVSLRNPTFDTYDVARRLYPHESHKLGALAEKFGIEYGELHRAPQDVDVAKGLFRVLRRTELALRVRASLPEMLPFLAVGCAAREAWYTHALAPCRAATGRWMRVHEVIREVAELYPPEVRVDVRRLLDEARRTPFPESREDDEWQSLRERFLNRVRRFEETNMGTSLRDFLNARSLAEPLDELDSNVDAVTLMTLHSAKGTEFRAVFVTTMEEGILPTFRAFQNEALMAEERRLCYVGMTRAKERLYFVSVRRRDGRDREPSRFLSEIPANLMKQWSPATERNAFL